LTQRSCGSRPARWDRRNKDACLAFATVIARFWTAPRKLGLSLMLDGSARAPVEALGLPTTVAESGRKFR
jgi:hypothetical protein